MSANDLINEVEGLTKNDTHEIQIQADKNLSECVRNYGNKQTAIQETSIETLKELKNSGELGRRQEEVYNYIKKSGACCIGQISKGLRLLPNQVTGRLKELREVFKCVGFSHKDVYDGRLVCFWKVVKDIDNNYKGGVKIWKKTNRKSV